MRCPLKQFGGEETELNAIVRVRPAAGAAVVLGDFYKIPAITPKIKARLNLKHFQNEVEFSGIFTAGAGEYPVDLIVADDHGRIFVTVGAAKPFRTAMSVKRRLPCSPVRLRLCGFPAGAPTL